MTARQKSGWKWTGLVALLITLLGLVWKASAYFDNINENSAKSALALENATEARTVSAMLYEDVEELKTEVSDLRTRMDDYENIKLLVEEIHDVLIPE